MLKGKIKYVVFATLALVLAISLVAFACAPAAVPETVTGAKPTYNWKTTKCPPVEPDNPSTISLQKIVDKIYEYSDGRITVVPYWGDVLGDWVWVMEQVSRGEIEMAMDPVPTEVDPRLNCVHMQYLYIGYEGAKNALGPGGKLLGLYKELAADNNWYLLGTEPTGSYGICTKDKIIRNPEDAKGVKIRVMPVKACEYGFNAMGFIATPIPYAELYTALQTGIVDARAESTPSEPIYFKDVIKYNIMTYDNFECHWVVINLDLWNSLSEEDQQIIQRAADEALGYSWENYLENMEKPYLEEFAAQPGKENIYLTNAELAVFAKRVREQAWPKMEELLGKTLYEKMLEVAEPLPE